MLRKAWQIWQQTTAANKIIIVLITPLLIFLLISIVGGYTQHWYWVGVGDFSSPEVEYGKTLWDWLNLLIVPAVLAGGAYWLNKQQREAEAKAEEQRAQEAALQSYLDRMTDLLRNELGDPEPDDKIKAAARTLTLTTLRRLDGARKGVLLWFLFEAKLNDKDEAVIDLNRADLSNADLSHANLERAGLTGTRLIGARLHKTNLHKAHLVKADLSEAELFEADMREANLSGAKLHGVDLTGPI